MTMVMKLLIRMTMSNVKVNVNDNLNVEGNDKKDLY